MCDRIASSPQHNHLPLCLLKRLFFVHNGVSKRGRATRVVSTTVPPSKAYFAFTTVLERRAHVPSDVLGVSIRDGRRENILQTYPKVDLRVHQFFDENNRVRYHWVCALCHRETDVRRC